MSDDPSRRALLRQASGAALTIGALATAACAQAAPASALAEGARSPVAFGADPTGRQDATAALRRWAAVGGELVLPAGTRFAVSGTLLVDRAGTRISGRGRLVARDGLAGRPLLRIEADDCIVDGIFLDNPDRLQSARGDQSYGIQICGHRNRVVNCTVTDFQMCLSTAPTGEFHDTLFAYNHCRVIGVGQEGEGLGEDRGDGITDWGARSRIIGNTVEAAPGRNGANDCRIGIHVEDLGAYAANKGGGDNAAGSEIIGNVVVPSADGTGRFRRCYSIEGVSHARVIANYGRGWTWDGIWLVGSSHHAVVADNVLRQDARGVDRAGKEWNPARAGILVYANDGVALRNVRVTGNNIDIGRGAHHGIQVQAANTVIDGVVVASNTCVVTESVDGGRCGVIVSDAVDVQVTDNRLKGPWDRGVRVLNSKEVEVVGCTITGATAFGITVQQASVRVGNNSISAVANGIESVGNADCLIDGNRLARIAGIGMSFASGDRALVTGNIVRGGTTRLARFGVPSIVTLAGNVGLVGG